MHSAYNNKNDYELDTIGSVQLHTIPNYVPYATLMSGLWIGTECKDYGYNLNISFGLAAPVVRKSRLHENCMEVRKVHYP